MNCSHKVRGIRVVVKDSGRNLNTHAFRQTGRVHAHEHTHPRNDIQTDIHNWETPAHSQWHPLYLVLSGGLLKPLLKSKQFHCSLWPLVFIFRALCSHSNCDSYPMESDRGNKRLRGMKRCQTLALLPTFISDFSHCYCLKCAIDIFF